MEPKILSYSKLCNKFDEYDCEVCLKTSNLILYSLQLYNGDLNLGHLELELELERFIFIVNGLNLHYRKIIVTGV